MIVREHVACAPTSVFRDVFADREVATDPDSVFFARRLVY
jgi:predicted lipid carrier protein YhbT